MVYCKDCKHFGWKNHTYTDTTYKHIDTTTYYCVVKKLKDMYGNQLGQPCRKFNSTNKCEFYKRKWWKFWI